MEKLITAILLTGCVLLAASSGIAADASGEKPPKVKLDLDNIKQALNKESTASDKTAASPANGMQANPAMTGSIGQQTPQERGEAMRKKFVNSNVMAGGNIAKSPQASNKENTASDKTAVPAPAASTGQMPATSAAPTVNGMQVGPAMMGTMGGSLISSDMMAEMQKKVMAENMKSIQESVQASIMESMKGAAQQTTKETKPE